MSLALTKFSISIVKKTAVQSEEKNNSKTSFKKSFYNAPRIRFPYETPDKW